VGPLDELGFAPGALGTGLLEPGGQDDGAAHALLPALVDDLPHPGRGDGDDGQVDLSVNVEKAVGAGQPQHRIPLGVDRVEGAGEAAALQVLQYGAADTVGALAGPDHGHGAGRKEGLQGSGCARARASSRARALNTGLTLSLGMVVS